MCSSIAETLLCWNKGSFRAFPNGAKVCPTVINKSDARLNSAVQCAAVKTHSLETIFHFQNFGNRICEQNSTITSKMQIGIKDQILGQRSNFGQKSKCWHKIKILAKNQNFDQKSKFHFGNGA